MFPSRNVMTSRRGNAKPWRRKNARQFQGLSAPKPPTGNVAASLSKNVLMCPSSSVSRFPRSTVRCLADNLALRFHQETANRNPDVFALLFPRSILRKSMTVSAPLIRGMSVSLFPSRSAMMSMSLAKFAMMSQRRFVTTDQQP